MQNFSTASAVYRSLGWQVVVPSDQAPNSKIPATSIKSVFGRGNTATNEQMDEWEANYPDRNCLLKMNLGVIGIDVDHYWKKRAKGGWQRKCGDDQLNQIFSVLGSFPKTFTSTSRGPIQPARIYFFQTGTTAEFPTKLAADIDVIQHHHRYAVVEASVHPETLSTYCWYDPNGLRCSPPRPSDLPYLPIEWVEYFAGSTSPVIKNPLEESARQLGLRGIYKGDPMDWINHLDQSDRSLEMELLFREIKDRHQVHIGHDILLSLLGRIHFLQSKRFETGGRSVFDLVIKIYFATTNEPRPERELRNAVLYVAGEDFLS
jgi:hypothetical protein